MPSFTAPRSVLAALALAVAVPAVASAGASAMDFYAQFRPRSDVLAHGDWATTPQDDLLGNLTFSSTAGPALPLYRAAQLTLRVYESRQTVGIAGQALPGAAPTRHSQTDHHFDAPAVSVTRLGEGNAWTFLEKAVHESRAAAHLRGSCHLAQADLDLPYAYLIHPEDVRLQDPESWVRADCRVDDLRLLGTFRLHVVDTDLLVDHETVDEDGQTRRSTTALRSGTWVEARPGALAVDERVTRTIAFIAQDPAGRLEASRFPAAHGRLYSPLFSVAGHVRAEAADGHLTWGPHSERLADMTFEASGSFLVGAKAKELWMRGVASLSREASSPAAPGPPVPAGLALGVAGVGLAGLAAWWLYTRLSRGQAAQHPHRDRILRTLTQLGGATVATLMDALGVSRRTVRHHLEVLKHLGFVESRTIAGQTAFFASPDPLLHVRELAWRLRDPPTRSVLRVLDENPLARQRDIAHRVGRGQPRVSKILATLRRLGAVEKVPGAGNRVAPWARRALWAA